MKDLESLLKSQFDDIIQYDKETSKIKNWLSWGNYALNYICSKNLNNGVPQGKVTSLSGLSGTGKSLLTLSLTKDTKIDTIILFETEGSATGDLLNFLNVDHKKVFVIKVETFSSYRINKKNETIEELPDYNVPKKQETDQYIYKEGLTAKVRRLINQLTFNKIDKNVLIILDSLANLQSVRGASGGHDMGKRGQDIANFFRSFDNAFEKSNIYFVFTNKLYQSFNPYQPYVESGGVSVIYNPSLSILLENTSVSDDVTDKETKEEYDRTKTALGRSIKKIKAIVKKSRFGTELRNIPFLLDFSTGGIAKLSGLFTLLKDFGIINNATSRTYNIPGIIDKPFFKKDFIGKILEDEENIINKLQEKLEVREEEILKNKSNLQLEDVDEDEEEILQVDNNEILKNMEKDVS